MTSFRGEFESDLPVKPAADACNNAIRNLEWDVEKIAPDRIVCYPTRSFKRYPPTIEVILRESADSTTIEIVGVDAAENPLEEEILIAELDRVRDAIKESIAELNENFDDRSREPASPSHSVEESEGPRRDQNQLATQRRALQVNVRESGGTLPISVEELLAQFGIPEFNTRTRDTVEAILITAGVQAEPPLGEVGPDDSLTLNLTGATTKTDRSNGRPAVSPGWYPDPEDALWLKWWDGDQWTDQTQPARAETGEPSETSDAIDAVQQVPEEVSTADPEGLSSTELPEPSVNRLAVASLTLSLVWLLGIGSMLAILFGGVALRQIDASAGLERGRDLATAGIALGAIGAAVTIGVAIATYAQ